MQSIRKYEGRLMICGECGQPCTEPDDDGISSHFKEQWDGVFCRSHPIAYPIGEITQSVTAETIKRTYPSLPGNQTYHSDLLPDLW